MIKKLLFLMMFILMSFSVVAVAPEEPTLKPPYNVILYDREPIYPNFLITDSDSLLLNCSLYYSNQTNYTERPYTLIDPQLADTENNIFNNTIEDFVLDITSYQENDVEQYIYYQLTCSDGVNSTSSYIWDVQTRPFFLYSEGDITNAIIDTLVKGMIIFGAVGVTLLVFGLVALYIFGKDPIKIMFKLK